MTDETPPRKRPLRRFLPLLLLALAAIGYGAYRYYQVRLPYEWSGTVEIRTMSVGSRAGGRVKDVRVREGDPVVAGQPLIELEPGDWPAQLAQAEGQLAQMKANQEKLERGARPEELEQAHARTQEAVAAFEESKAGARKEQVGASEAGLAVQEVALEKARIDAARLRKVLDLGSGAVSQAEVDQADTALKSAVAGRDLRREQLAELKNGSRPEELEQARARALQAGAAEKLLKAGSREEDLAIARAQVLVAQGKVDQVKTMIDELLIRSPRAARVEACELRPGDILAPNATAATLLEEGEMYVRIFVPETQLGHIQVGQTIPITVDSFPDRSFQGVVEHLNGVGEFSPRNLQTADERADQVFSARIGIRTGKDQLRAGMAAFIRVPR